MYIERKEKKKEQKRIQSSINATTIVRMGAKSAPVYKQCKKKKEMEERNHFFHNEMRRIPKNQTPAGAVRCSVISIMCMKYDRVGRSARLRSSPCMMCLAC